MRSTRICLLAIAAMTLTVVGYAGTFFNSFDDGDADGWWLGHNQVGVYGTWRVENGGLAQDRPGDAYVALVDGLMISTQSIEARMKMNDPSGYGAAVMWYLDQNNLVAVNLYPAPHLVQCSSSLMAH